MFDPKFMEYKRDFWLHISLLKILQSKDDFELFVLDENASNFSTVSTCSETVITLNN